MVLACAASASAQLPTVSDFDGDSKTGIAVWRPSTGIWHLHLSSGATVERGWGLCVAAINDILVPGDYDGDGRTDFAVWRPAEGMWWVIRSSDGSFYGTSWGLGFPPFNDIPVPGDYDGAGRTDFGVWRPAEGMWWVIRSSDGSFYGTSWGLGFPPFNDIPVPGDYDGDGRTDFAVWRPAEGMWWVIRSTDGTFYGSQLGAGVPPYNDIPAPGDYDGDGRTDVAVWRAQTGVWSVIRSSDGGVVSLQWGESGDIPVTAARSLAIASPSSGGFLEKAGTQTYRRRFTRDEIQSFLPPSGATGPFKFPAPYGTSAVRLTNANDCGGTDCLAYVGYSYWRNTNNHVGQPEMLIFLGLDRNSGGPGPSLLSYNKTIDQVRNVGPLFPPTSVYSYATGEGWYFSGSQATKLYTYLVGGSVLRRYDVLSHQFDQT